MGNLRVWAAGVISREQLAKLLENQPLCNTGTQVISGDPEDDELGYILKSWNLKSKQIQYLYS